MKSKKIHGEKYCNKHNIDLIIIKYDEFDNIKNIITSLSIRYI